MLIKPHVRADIDSRRARGVALNDRDLARLVVAGIEDGFSSGVRYFTSRGQELRAIEDVLAALQSDGRIHVGEPPSTPETP